MTSKPSQLYVPTSIIFSNKTTIYLQACYWICFLFAQRWKYPWRCLHQPWKFPYWRIKEEKAWPNGMRKLRMSPPGRANYHTTWVCPNYQRLVNCCHIDGDCELPLMSDTESDVGYRIISWATWLPNIQTSQLLHHPAGEFLKFYVYEIWKLWGRRKNTLSLLLNFEMIKIKVV